MTKREKSLLLKTLVIGASLILLMIFCFKMSDFMRKRAVVKDVKQALDEYGLTDYKIQAENDIGTLVFVRVISDNFDEFEGKDFYDLDNILNKAGGTSDIVYKSTDHFYYVDDKTKAVKKDDVIIWGTDTVKYNNTTTAEPEESDQRCIWCGKVIFHNGEPIHATYEMGNSYKCDYCGHTNVKE